MTERRQAAILAADVAGYSSLMQADEDGTFRRVSGLLAGPVAQALAAYRGRVVKFTGDGLLATFAEAAEALRAALGFQSAIAAANAGAPPSRRIRLRVGITTGEVIVSEADVFGDVVNVAARLEAMAPPGGILVSGAVHENVRGRLNCSFEDWGELAVRGMARPVHSFSVTAADPTGAAPRLALPLPAKPSLAVMPFDNLSGDPDQGYFADGMVTDIIAALSQVRAIFVISRNSTFAYRGRRVEPRQVGRELGVRYLLDGSVRRAGDRLRITGELIEAATDTQLWTGRFDGKLADMFELQDQVSASVAAAIEPRLRSAEVERVKRRPLGSLAAHDLFLRATGHFYAMTQDDIQKALELTDLALTLDPDSALNMALGGRCRLHRKVQGWIAPSDPSIAEGARLARLAVEKDRDNPEVLWMAGVVIALAGGDVAGGIALVDRSLLLNPNSSEALTYSGMTRAFMGGVEIPAALEHLERAHRLSPLDLQTYNKHLATTYAHFMAGRYEQALHWSEQSLNEKLDYAPAWRMRAASFGMLGRWEEGGEAVRRLLAISPAETVAAVRAYYSVSMKHRSGLEALLDGVARAGLPPGEGDAPALAG